MTIRIVRLGSRREKNEGLRIGTVRRPPRGVRKKDYASKNIYDVWFPNLSPSESLLKEALPLTDDKSWRSFKRRFMAEMKGPGQRGIWTCSQHSRIKLILQLGVTARMNHAVIDRY